MVYFEAKWFCGVSVPKPVRLVIVARKLIYWPLVPFNSAELFTLPAISVNLGVILPVIIIGELSWISTLSIAEFSLSGLFPSIQTSNFGIISAVNTFS